MTLEKNQADSVMEERGASLRSGLLEFAIKRARSKTREKPHIFKGGEMSGMNGSTAGLTRRSFLKTTAAVAGVAAVAGTAVTGTLAPVAEAGELAAEESVFHSGCRGNCGSKCHMDVTVREGKVVKVAAAQYPEADAQWRRICVKGYTQPQRLYDPDRLKYPMRRVEGTERGAGQWERISWDEAIAEVSGKIGAAIKQYGGTSFAVWSSYASYGVLNGAQAGYMSVAYGRFLTAIGGTVLGASADYAQIYEQMIALGNTGNSFADAVNSKYIFSWGGNPAEAYIHAWQFVCQAREKGAKLITIDPQYTASAAHSDMYVPIRPGTDGALMLAMANYIHENNLCNEEYMRTLTVAPFLVGEDGTYVRMSAYGQAAKEGPLNAYGMPTVIDPIVVWDEATGAQAPLEQAEKPAILGEYTLSDGRKVKTCYQVCLDNIKEYTVAKAAEICDIPEEDIIKLAQMYADGPSFVMTFQGFGHHVNSHHNFKNLALIACQTGNYGVPGGAICGNTSPFNSLVNNAAFFMGKLGVNTTGTHLPEILEKKSWGGKECDIQVLWCCNGNMLCCESGRQELIEAVKKVPYVVCADVNMTDTAKYADLVLPVPHIFETEDYDSGCPTPYLMFQQKAVEPAFECKTDLEIMRSIAETLGMGAIYGNGASNKELIDAVLKDANGLNEKFGINYDRFQKDSMVRTPLYTSTAPVAATGSAETARVKFYLEKPTPRGYVGQKIADYEKRPYYEPAHEAYWENPMREKYPLMGCSQHHKYHVHSQLAYTPMMRELEPEPQIKINASDAAARGIKQGDVVRAYNDHGYVVLKALVTEGIKPGVISIPHGFQEEQFIEGHAQDLTNIYMNDFCDNSAFYDFLCEVEKYKGGK